MSLQLFLIKEKMFQKMMIYNCCVIHEVLTVKNDDDQHFNCRWPNKYSE